MTSPNSRTRTLSANVSQTGKIIPIGAKAITIITSKVLIAPRDVVWDSLIFYEQIEQEPPLLLRLLLPMPVRSEGEKRSIGDVATCVYSQGHLLKKVTQITSNELYEFQVIEQQLVFGGGLRLLGGSYGLRSISSDRTEVAVTTRYISLKQPRFLWEPVEARVCHAFHRFLLQAIQKKAIASIRTIAPGLQSVPRPPD